MMKHFSDGLASELPIAKESRVGLRIYEDKVPIDEQTYSTAVEFKLDPITCALNGGKTTVCCSRSTKQMRNLRTIPTST